MELLPVRADGDCTAMAARYAELIRMAMAQKQLRKTDLLNAKLIKRSTWKQFDSKLDKGTISVSELDNVLVFLGIEPVRAALTLHHLKDVSEYFEPTCETASFMAIEIAVLLTEKMASIEGNFNSMKQTVCRTLAERQVSGLLERNQAINAVIYGRDFQIDR